MSCKLYYSLYLWTVDVQYFKSYRFSFCISCVDVSYKQSSPTLYLLVDVSHDLEVYLLYLFVYPMSWNISLRIVVWMYPMSGKFSYCISVCILWAAGSPHVSLYGCILWAGSFLSPMWLTPWWPNWLPNLFISYTSGTNFSSCLHYLERGMLFRPLSGISGLLHEDALRPGPPDGQVMFAKR